MQKELVKVGNNEDIPRIFHILTRYLKKVQSNIRDKNTFIKYCFKNQKTTEKCINT